MKTRLAALAVLLMAGVAPAAFAQDHGPRHGHRDVSGGERPGIAPGQRSAAQARAWQPRAFSPRTAPAAPEARQAPAAPAPAGAPADRSGERSARHGNGPRAEHPRVDRSEAGRNFVRRPGTWVDTEGDDTARDLSPADRADHEDRQEQHDWRRYNGGAFDTGQARPPRVDSWGGDRSGGRGERGGGDRQGADRGDHRGDRAGDHRGDRGGDHADHRGDRDHRGPGAADHHRQWRPGAYPHSFRSGHRFHVRPYIRPPHFYAHIWNFGEFLPQAWYAPEYLIEDWWDYDLPAPPYGYDWVRVGDDALLIDEYDGRVVQAVRDLFW
jgi:Ni/Co efflux regulator RcnB